VGRGVETEETPLTIASTAWRKGWALPTRKRRIVGKDNVREIFIGKNRGYKLDKASNV
jgi:hypothetical protein